MQTLNGKLPRDSHENLYSSDDDNMSDEDGLPSMQGKLFKWTNMLHGWQERFFHLRDGVFSYFKSRDDVNLGCRGSIRLLNAYVRPHEADDCRFEIRVGDSIWYLRGGTIEERRKWIEAIEAHRINESGYGSEQNLRRHSSWHSLNSAASLSIASASSFKRSHGLKEKLAEMETFKEILCRQVESLQNYFDTCSAIVRDSAHDQLDFYEEMPEYSDEHEYPASVAGSGGGGSHGTAAHTTNSGTGAPATARRQPFQGHRHTASDATSVSSESVNSDISALGGPAQSAVDITPTAAVVIIHNGQIEAAHNGTIFEDARETLSDVSPTTTESTAVDKTVAKEATVLPPQRGFLSKFFPFRSSAPTVAVVTSPLVATPPVSPVPNVDATEHDETTPVANGNCYSDQYEPSSRFEDLRKIINQHGGHALDFKGESYTFKATTTGILTNLCYCIEIMQQREESWRRRLEREREKRRRVDDQLRSVLQEVSQLHHQVSEQRCGAGSSGSGPMKLSSPSGNSSNMASAGTTSSKMLIVGSPDLQEGPNCTIGEEEFFDAVDAQLDQMELADERKVAMQKESISNEHQLQQQRNLEPPKTVDSSHRLYDEVETVVRRHLVYCDPTARELRPEDGWQIIAEEGEMRIYKKELENEQGIVLDPLHIVHEVAGVTAREMCRFFWDVRFRLDWEISIDQPPTVLERVSEDTVLLHQVYKRVWPTSQRDSVYWSHMRRVDHRQLAEAGLLAPDASGDKEDNEDMWLVMNYSTEDYKAPHEDPLNQMIRLMLDVVLICQTVVLPDTGEVSLTRDRLVCRVLYASSINPGGWAPASVLRTVARREYPRFIKRFSQYVVDKTVDIEPLF